MPEQLNRGHLAQIHAHGVVGALGRLLGLGLGRDLPLDLEQLAAFGLGLVLGGLWCSPPSSSLASSVSMTFTPISLNMARTSSICSELTSPDGRTEFISSWVT